MVSGRIKEALLRAQEGQLWGPALILASQLGDQVCFCSMFFSYEMILCFITNFWCLCPSVSVFILSYVWFYFCVLIWDLEQLQFYVDTVKQMALRQLVAGSPLRTLCLLIAGQPADVFTSDVSANSGLPGAFNISQQPAQVRY